MAKIAASNEKFPWEYPIPDNEFWSSLDFKIGRAFVPNFTPKEIEDMNLNPKLTEEEKLHLLAKLLQEKLDAEEAANAPKHLHDVDYPSWSKLLFGMSFIAHAAGNMDEQERILRSMIALGGKDGKDDFSVLSSLAWVMQQKGQYAEAEKIIRQVMPSFKEHELLGVDAPQTLGNTRHLIKCIWKQDREDEANELVKETFELIAGMDKGKFAKYQVEEKEALEELVVELKG